MLPRAQVLLGMAVLLCPVRGCPREAKCSFSSSGVCIAGWMLFDKTGGTAQSCYVKLSSEADCRGQLCRAESTCCPSSTITATKTTTTVETTALPTTSPTALPTTSTTALPTTSTSSSSSSSFSSRSSTPSSDACNVVECSTYCTDECRWSAASNQCIRRKNRNNETHENGLGNCTLQPTPDPSSTGSNSTLVSVTRVAKRGHVAAIVLLSVALILTWLLGCLRHYGYLGCFLKGGRRHFNAMKNDVPNVVYDGASDTNHADAGTLHKTTHC